MRQAGTEPCAALEDRSWRYVHFCSRASGLELLYNVRLSVVSNLSLLFFYGLSGFLQNRPFFDGLDGRNSAVFLISIGVHILKPRNMIVYIMGDDIWEKIVGSGSKG